MMEQLKGDAMAQVLAIMLLAISRQLDTDQLRDDLLALAEAPGPHSLPGVREVVTALTRLLPGAPGAPSEG
jgi:hypothetical protein